MCDFIAVKVSIGFIVEEEGRRGCEITSSKVFIFHHHLNFRAFPLSAIYNQRLGSAFACFTNSALSTAYTNKVTYSPNYRANKRNSSKGNKFYFYRYIYPNIDKEEVLAHFDAEDRNSPTGYISYN